MKTTQGEAHNYIMSTTYVTSIRILLWFWIQKNTWIMIPRAILVWFLIISIHRIPFQYLPLVDEHWLFQGKLHIWLSNKTKVFTIRKPFLKKFFIAWYLKEDEILPWHCSFSWMALKSCFLQFPNQSLQQYH